MHPRNKSSSNGLKSLLVYSSSSSDDSEDNNDCRNSNKSFSCQCHEITDDTDDVDEVVKPDDDNDSYEASHPKRARLSLKDDRNCGSDSSNICNTGTTSKDKNVKLLPMPSEVLKMFPSGDPEKQIDDPALHQGRTRSFPHERGNWVSYLYLRCPANHSAVESFISIMEFAKNRYENDIAIHLMDDIHLSVSRTLPFRHHWIDLFVENMKKIVGGLQCIDLTFDGFEAYENDEKSRTFLSMKVITTNALLELVNACDACLADFHLEPYYKNPSFHISCAWILGSKKSWAEEIVIPLLNSKWKKISSDDTDLNWITADSLEFKTGNKLYRFPFAK